MSNNQQGQEKTEEASPKKREDARKKGQVAKSQDLVNAVSLMAASMMLPGVFKALSDGLTKAIESPEISSPKELTLGGIYNYMGAIGAPMFAAAAPMLGVLMVVGVVASIGQTGPMFSWEPIKPTFQKINPVEGFKRIFSKRQLFEGFKAIFKLSVFSYLGYSSVADKWNQIASMNMLTPPQSMALVGQVSHDVMQKIAMTWIGLAVLDYIFQRKEFEHGLKMTKQELRQEFKDQEGNLEVKAARFQRRRKMAKGGLAARIQEADVIVTNPTHFAIALKYDRSAMHAPMVIAKGQDYLALKIRELAGGYDVPIVENKPLARALYKQCEVGDFVPRDLFGGVAEVLAYVYKTVKSAKKKA